MAAEPPNHRDLAPRYALDELRDRLAEAVAAARDNHEPVLITDQDEPLAAIISIEELDRLYEARELAEEKAIIAEFEAEEARGEVVWHSHAEMLAFCDELVKEAEAEAERRLTHPHPSATEDTPR